MSVSDKCCSRNALCTLYWISTFLIILFCADVECQDSTFIIGNRAIYTCSLTITDFDEIVIAKLSDTSLTLATISSNGTITYMIQIDATITYVAGEKVEFTISNISCFDEGTYEITVRGNFEDRSSKGNITVQSKSLLHYVPTGSSLRFVYSLYVVTKENKELFVYFDCLLVYVSLFCLVRFAHSI